MKDSSGNDVGRVELPVPQTVKGGWKDVSRRILFPADADTFFLRFSGVDVLLDNVFMEATGPTASGWGKSIPLESDRICFKGAKYVYREDSQIAPLRFSREVLATNPAQLNFNPGVARMSSGIEMCFSTDSSTISVKALLKPFRKEKAAYFQVYRDGQLFKEFEFSRPKENDLPVEMALFAEDGAVHNYRIVFPATAEVVVTGLTLDVDSELEPMTPEKKPVYVALGDSISQGTMALFGRSEWSYPFLLSRALGYDLYNLGVGGSRVSVAIGEMLADWEQIDLMTLLIGANDFSWAAVPPAKYRTNYIKLIEAVRRHHPDVPLFCITLTYTTREAGDSGDATEAYRQVVRDVVKEFQAAGDDRIFLLEGEELSGTDCLSDWVHLSIEGNRTVAGNLYKKILEAGCALPATGNGSKQGQ
jgi:lysophospholipase L1-like esterase